MDKYTLKTAFQKSFSGVIWRIEADTMADILAVETRDAATGNPAFSAIRYTNGEWLVKETRYGDRHWTLASVTGGKLILKALGHHRPDSAGIASMDTGTGDISWEQFNYTLLAIRNGLLAVRHRSVEGGFEQYLNPRDGNLTHFNISTDKPTAPPIVIPVRYTDERPMLLVGKAIVGDLWHCQLGDDTIWAFHEADGQLFRVRLLITNGLNILADQVVLSGLAKMAPELFFAIRKQLFLISNNKQEIVSYLV